MARARPLDWMNPTYDAVYRERGRRLAQVRAHAAVWRAENEDNPNKPESPWDVLMRHYAQHPVDFIEDWLFTYDPRLVSRGIDPYIPFILMPRQRELIEWIGERFKAREAGVVEKSRDTGVSWNCLAWSLWAWLFKPGIKISFGSRKETLVDNIGDPDSLLQKIRLMVGRLPQEMRPLGYDEDKHARYMKLTNPENGALITGEAGKNIGRGGRSSVYFVDESAFIEEADAVDAALSGNTEVRIDVSTPNPERPDCPFHRRARNNVFPVFRYHWRNDLRKDDAWYEHKKKTMEPEKVAAEIDIDYDARVEEVAIPGKWIRSSQEFRRHLERKGLLIRPEKAGVGGLDVGAGVAESVFIARWDYLVSMPRAWTDADTMNTAGRAEQYANESGCDVIKYDVIGVGQGVSAGLARIKNNRIAIRPVNVGNAPTDALWPDGKRASDKFSNLKAELWWIVRDRLRKTHEHWLFLSGQPGGEEHELADLLLLPDDERLGSQLSTVKYGYTEKGLLKMESKERLRTRGVASPDRAEALVLTFAPKPAKFKYSRARGYW
jgi:phage terminase large subunit